MLHQKSKKRTFPAVQCLRTHLPRQETRVQSPVLEGPTCCGATESPPRGPWVRALGPTRLEPVLRNKRSPCKEKSVRCNQEQPLPTATRGSLHSATETPRSQTNKILEKDETRTHLLQQTFYVARDNVLANELLNDWVRCPVKLC